MADGDASNPYFKADRRAKKSILAAKDPRKYKPAVEALHLQLGNVKTTDAAHRWGDLFETFRSSFAV